MASPEPEHAPPSGRRHFRAKLAVVTRWVHLYASMIGLAALFFFSLTGLTLNHADWTFGCAPREADLEGDLDQGWMRSGQPEVARLEIAEALRARHGLRGTVEDFQVQDDQCSVSFKAPGSSAEATIDRATGHYQLHTVSEGWISVANDLHKGSHSGRAWSWVIDVSAVLLALVSATGLVLVFYVRRRRVAGLLWALAGLAAVVVIALWRSL